MASKASLSECCRKHGLPVTGNKDELLERLLGEEHILKAVLDAKPSKKKDMDKTSPLLKKTIGKKNAYEQFCDKTRPLLIAGGMTDGAQISRKLAEMYTSGGKKAVAVTSHVGHVSEMPPEVLAAMGLSHPLAAPPVAPPAPPAPRGPIFDPATIPDNMVLSMVKIPDQVVPQAGMQLVSEGSVPSGQQAWLYLKNSVGSSSGSLPGATAMPAPPAARPAPLAPPSPAPSSSNGGLYSQSEATLRASLMALGLSIDGDKRALVERLMRACGPMM